MVAAGTGATTFLIEKFSRLLSVYDAHHLAAADGNNFAGL